MCTSKNFLWARLGSSLSFVKKKNWPRFGHPNFVWVEHDHKFFGWSSRPIKKKKICAHPQKKRGAASAKGGASGQSIHQCFRPPKIILSAPKIMLSTTQKTYFVLPKIMLSNTQYQARQKKYVFGQAKKICVRQGKKNMIRPATQSFFRQPTIIAFSTTQNSTAQKIVSQSLTTPHVVVY